MLDTCYLPGSLDKKKRKNYNNGKLNNRKNRIANFSCQFVLLLIELLAKYKFYAILRFARTRTSSLFPA